MYTKLDKALTPKVESTLTPYEKAARLALAYMLAGKMGSFDPTDQAHNQALETEMLEYEQVAINATNTGDAGDVKNGPPKPSDNPKAEPVKVPETPAVPSNPESANIKK